MGNSNSSTRDSHVRRSMVLPASPTSAMSAHAGADRDVYSSRPARHSRADLSFLHLGARDRASEREAQPEPRRETKQEREARKLERERVAREKERERSVREEGVDGGFLVTLGTYTGPEDFNKAAVRGLMIERRLAPFWKGLNDHSDSWTETQLVAAVRGLPIPAPDEIPPELERTFSRASHHPPSDAQVNSLTVPIGGRSQSYQSERSTTLSPSRPSSSYPNNPPSSSSGTNFIRGRAKTLASPFTSKVASSSPTPQEVNLPDDPYIKGQPIEAYLYKDASECPICFLYYPPYLNRTRCCDQPICSECFVQIKRPDPHPPEHHDDPSNPTPPPPPEEEGLLVSEPSACPFCVTPEFGVTYEPPPYRRGLVFSGPASRNPLSSPNSAMASTTSLQSPGQGRRRTTSLSASAPQVITTDRVRPDWAKKLADARAHALRRSAAATALHNAAYMLGNNQAQDSRGFSLGRRRRTILIDSASGSGSGTPARLADNHPLSHLSSLILHNDNQGSDSDLTTGRSSTRRSRVQDLEDLMMMEAIRMSLASEEDRKKKEEKEAKKAEKQKAKENKKAEKSMKKNGAPYNPAMNASTSTWASMTRSSSNLGQSSSSPPAPPPPPSSSGKGKAPVSADTSVGFNPMSEPTSTLNRGTEQSTDAPATSSSIHTPSDDPQRHLENQRANLSQTPTPQPQPSQPISCPPDHRAHLRHLSNDSSAASSMVDSTPSSYHRPSELGESSKNASGVNLENGNTETPENAHSGSGTPGNGAGLEPMFNFRSLAAMIGNEDKQQGAEHNEFVESLTPEQQASRNASIASSSKQPAPTTRSRGDSEESSASGSASVPPAYLDDEKDTKAGAQAEASAMPGHIDQKHSEAVIQPARNGQIAQ